MIAISNGKKIEKKVRVDVTLDKQKFITVNAIKSKRLQEAFLLLIAFLYFFDAYITICRSPLSNRSVDGLCDWNVISFN